MSRAAQSALIWGIYNGLLGLGLLLVPQGFCALFGLAPPADFWSRWAGGLLCAIAYLYLRSAQEENRPMFRYSVEARPAVIVVAIVLVATGQTQWPMIGFGVVEVLGALWMAWALRQSSASASTRPTAAV